MGGRNQTLAKGVNHASTGGDLLCAMMTQTAESRQMGKKINPTKGTTEK